MWSAGDAMSLHVAVEGRGEILWRPSDDSVSSSRIGGFLARQRTEHGMEFADYQQLWDWSVRDLPAFWAAVWQYLDPISDGTPEPVLAVSTMPGAQWFPNIELNYAENALRGPGEGTPGLLAEVLPVRLA